MSKLTGKVAVVTGASKGIGAAIAKSLAAEGASVVVNYASSKAGADAVVAAIRHFNINVLGLLLVTQATVKYLGEGGSIINMGSVASRITSPNSAVYSGTKAAVDAITIVLSRELGPKKIRVNTLSPGIVETEGTHSGGFIGSEFEKFALAQTPLGRIGQPSDIASIAVFLASEDSAWLTGERLLASGGFR
jgi:3-oxoacyl-[acyl-carrier protein] reductase